MTKILTPATGARRPGARTLISRRGIRTAGELITVPLAVIVVWWVLSIVVGPIALASPPSTAQTLATDGATWGVDITTTLLTLLYSYVIVAVGGILVGFVLGLSPFWSDVLRPILVAGYSLPKIVLYPIFLLLFGVTEVGRVLFAALHGIIPVTIVTMEAARNIPSIYLKVGRSFGMSRFQVVRYVLMPGVFVHIISGLRIGFSLTFLGVIVAEYFSSYNGLGYLLNVLLTGQQTAGVLGVIVIIFAIAAIGHLLFILLERRVAARGVDQDLTQELSELR